MESPGGSQTQQHLKNLIYGQIAPRATLKIWVMLKYLAGAGHSSPRYCGRLPPGRRGLKPMPCGACNGTFCRLPPGRRGLKLRCTGPDRLGCASPSPRKAWIETGACRSTRHWSAESPSPRKAWIETPSKDLHTAFPCVAFPPEGVD